MKCAQLMVIGGFLGAGKTTAMMQLAEWIKAQDKTVGLITNDQTDFLVDTQYVKSQALDVAELTGSCFCCNYPGFAEKVGAMATKDFVLAEPVGSCTDLVSTIMKPSKAGKAGDIAVLPLSVLVEPARLAQFMAKDTSVFSEGVYYIMAKQMEEADFIVLNKIDTLDDARKEALLDFLKGNYPHGRVLEISATTGEGLKEWLSAVTGEEVQGASTRKIAVEYQTYGDAEAEMGWLNAQVTLHGGRAFDGNRLLQTLGQILKESVADHQGEIGHLKLFLEGDGDSAKLSCTSIQSMVNLDKALTEGISGGKLTINLRAAVDPEILRAETEAALGDIKGEFALDTGNYLVEAFRPGFPNPTYRL